jgi:O-antigen ligase
VALLVLLVPNRGAGLGIEGAGMALCGAYAAMLAAIYLLTRSLFRVGFEWRRLAQLTAILAAVAISGELLLPSHGLAGLALRAAWLALVPALLLFTRFFHPRERAQVRELLLDARKRVAAYRARGGEVEAYAEDPLRDL